MYCEDGRLLHNVEENVVRNEESRSRLLESSDTVHKKHVGKVSSLRSVNLIRIPQDAHQVLSPSKQWQAGRDGAVVIQMAGRY